MKLQRPNADRCYLWTKDEAENYGRYSVKFTDDMYEFVGSINPTEIEAIANDGFYVRLRNIMEAVVGPTRWREYFKKLNAEVGVVLLWHLEEQGEQLSLRNLHICVEKSTMVWVEDVLDRMKAEDLAYYRHVWADLHSSRFLSVGLLGSYISLESALHDAIKQEASD